MATFKSGKEGGITISGAVLCVSGWSYTEEITPLDTSNTCSGGFETVIAGMKKLTGQFSAYWDADQIPSLDPPNIVAGAIITQMKLFHGPIAENKFALIDDALIISVAMTSDAKGLVSYQVSFQSNGQYTLPV